MRKLLQNKAVVSSLVVVAATCVAANFIKVPDRAATLTAQARVTTETAIPAVVQYPIRPPLRVEQTLSDWPRKVSETALARDPFRRIRRTPAPTTNQVAATPPPTFTIQAISIENGRSSAIINRRIVGPGDRIDGYQIDEILPGHVRLTGPAGQFTVPIRSASVPLAPDKGTLPR